MTDVPSDRRSQPRAGLLGKALVVRGPSVEPAEFSIRDLSTGGARLIGRTPLVEGTPIRVELELDGVQLAITAEVVRVEPQNAQVAIAFRDLSRDALAVIERAVVALIDRVRASSPPTVLIFGAAGETRAALERDLAQLGRAVRACTTLLEAVWSLDDPTVPHQAVILSSEVDHEQLAELLKHLGEHHPKVRRILLFGEQLESVEHAISSRVDAVLRTPLRLRALARALGEGAADSSIALILTKPES